MVNNETQEWEDYVNSYIFANFESLEYWVAKRYVAEQEGDDIYILNYIKFPKAENGSVLTEALLKYMIQCFEAETDICENVFGPYYKPGKAEIVNTPDALSIVWNKKSYNNELLDIEDPGQYNTCIRLLYNWNIFVGSPSLSIEEKERRQKIDNHLRRMSKTLNNPNLLPENRSKKEMEEIYKIYNWDEILKNNQ